MKVNINNEIGEKDTKQAISSFKRLVKYIMYKLAENVDDRQDKSFQMVFDNNEQFYVGLSYTDTDNINIGYSYFNAYGEELKEIPLQTILNIVKYSLDIEQIFKDDLGKYEMKAYYTEQSPINPPIFKEKDVGLEQRLKDEIIDVDVENVLEF